MRAPDQAESLWRPFWRRERRIARPARVDIRCRNPCLLARRRFFGWNVRFTNDSHVRRPATIEGRGARRRRQLHSSPLVNHLSPPASRHQEGPVLASPPLRDSGAVFVASLPQSPFSACPQPCGRAKCRIE